MATCAVSNNIISSISSLSCARSSCQMSSAASWESSCSIRHGNSEGQLRSTSSPSGAYPTVRCGRGDMRTAKGKRTRGSHGNSRPKPSKGVKTTGLQPAALPVNRPKRKDLLDDTEYVHIDLDEGLPILE